MRYPTLFVNHGGGPLPLMGRDPDLVLRMKEAVSKWLPKEKPKSIVMISAHWESDPIKITSHPNPPMLYDYYGFPPETYEYQYPAPGNPSLAVQIQKLLQDQGLPAQLDAKRGFDHGVFVPLMVMYPDADIPVVSVSLHSSLDAQTNWNLGRALAPLRDEGVLILGSGYTFHNMNAFFNPSPATKRASTEFNRWLMDTLVTKSSDTSNNNDVLKHAISHWHQAPGARECHPREEHLLPLFVTAAAGSDDQGAVNTTLLYETPASGKDHAVSSFMFD